LKRTLLTLSLRAAAITGCATPKQPVAKIGDLAPGSFQKTWSVPTSFEQVDQAYLAGKTLFLYGPNNTIAAFDANGVPKFRIPVGQKGEIVGPPMVQPTRIVFPTSSTLELLTPLGVTTRSIALSQPPRSPGVLLDDTVYIGSDSDTGGRLAAIALDKRYDIYRWTLLTGIVHTQPALFKNYLYAATEDGRVYALTLDRYPLWPKAPELPDGIFHTDGKIVSALKVDDAGVYVPSTDTKLYCLDPITGRLKWEYFASTPVSESPEPTKDLVYIAVHDKGIVALPKKSTQRINTPRWNYIEGKQLLADDDKYAYLLTHSGHIVAIDKSSGSLAFSTARGDFVMGIPHIDPKDNSIYAITKTGELVCVSPVLKSGVVGELVLNDAPAGR